MQEREVDYIHVSQWMWSKKGLGLKLGSVELMLFARIHGFSRQDAGIFYESQQNTAILFDVARESINRALKTLLKKGFILEAGKYTPGSNKERKGYRTSAECVNLAIENLSAANPSCDNLSHEQANPSCDNLSHDHKGIVTNCHTDSKDSSSTYNSYSIQPSTKPTCVSASDGWSDGFLNFTETERKVLRELKLKSINRNMISAADAPFSALLQQGIAPELISKAWDAHQNALTQSGCESKYFTQLAKWLRSPACDGAHAACENLMAKAKEHDKKNRQMAFMQLYVADRTFEKMVNEARSAEDRLREFGEGTELDVKNLWKSVGDYRDSHISAK